MIYLKGMEMQHQKNKFVFRLKAIHLAVAALPMMAGWMPYANADCTPDPVTSGSRVTCSGTDTNGFSAAAGVDNLNIRINSGTVLQPNVSANPSVTLFVNAGNTIINNGRIENLGGTQATNYLVNLNGGNNKFTNNGEMLMSVTTADIIATAAKNTRTLRGFYTSSASGEFEDISIINNGTITLNHAGVGAAQGFYPGEEIEGLTIDNAGTISMNRTSPLTITVSGGNVFGNSGIAGTSASALGVAAAIGSDDDAEMKVINRQGGVIQATGTYAAAIFSRAQGMEIENAGTISSDAIAISAHGGAAGEHGNLGLTNLKSGMIVGDVLAVDANALRIWAQEAKGLVGLTLNNQAGVRDSQINNQGTINGQIYLGSGVHELKNEGSINGNILVDQNGVGTAIGERIFSFENSGIFSGNMTVKTVSTSSMTFIPTITGYGLNSTLETPSSNVAGLGNIFKIFNGTAAIDGSNSTADLAVIAPKLNSAVRAGQWFKLSDTLYGSILPSAENSALVTWEIAKNTAGNLVAGVASVADLSEVGVNGKAVPTLNALLAYTGSDQGVNELAGTVLNLSTDEDVKKAAEQLRTEVNGASVQAVQGLTDRVYGLVGAHLGETHLAKASGNSGVASGDAANDSGVWFQGFGGRGDQGRRSGVDGYDIDAYGFAAGADTLVSDSNVRVGAALSYGQSNVEDKGVRTGNRTDINSYQGLAYASWLFDQWYLNAALGLGQHKFDDKKLVLGNKITGSHDAWQYSARVDAGYPIQLGSARLIPVASMTYSHLNQDSYTENGLGAQKISADNTDSLRSGLGLKALFPLYEGGVNASLELRTIWNHELADRSQDMTARFVGGGSAYTVKGLDLPRDSANLGASLRVSSVGQSLQQSLLLSYDAEVKNQFTSHTARLQARFDF